MNPNRQEFHANMRGGFPSPLSGPHGWEPGPRPLHLHHPGSGTFFQKSDGTSKIKGASNGLESPPTPEFFQRNPSYPPGFDNGQRNQTCYENSHCQIRFQESLEITSDRPFLPRRKSSSDGCHASEDQIPILDNQGTRGEMCGSPQILRKSVGGRACEAPDGDLIESLPTKRRRKKAKLKAATSMNAQPVHADSVVSLSSFDEEMPPSIPGRPLVPRSDGATAQKFSTKSFERSTKVCQKLWEDLNSAIEQRERALRKREQDCTQSTINKEALAEEKKAAAAAMQSALEDEKKQAAALKSEIIEERRKLEDKAQRIREEEDALERTSTEIALQMVELKQLQKQIEKEKAALLALKGDPSAKERKLQVQDRVGVSVTASLGIVEAEIGEPLSNMCRNCGKSPIHEADARPSNIQNQGAKLARDVISVAKVLPVACNRNFEPVKVEFVTSGSDPALRDESFLDGNSSEDKLDDLPLALRLKPQRVENRREGKEVWEKTMQQESNIESSRRRKSLPHDTQMKSNKVAIEVALQEDAPGLLEQLEEKGLLEDMSVYQDLGPDDSRSSESPAIEFGQLEGVVSKLWGSSAGLAKDLVPIKGQGQGPGNMPRYCLACLLSLIEQTKLLRKRNWPVEWGWCRRLRAFVFVFEKHNRVVLERPEYGYATYFFELVQRLPIKWQVQRLITIMSVASTGRAALLENRQLLVGTDLSDEDAAVLEDYGWTRSSGLGSLLNFCDRVVHDYNKGQDPAELGNDWKQKIGKLLMDGYDQGSILTTSIPKKLETLLGKNLSDVETCAGLNIKAEPL